MWPGVSESRSISKQRTKPQARSRGGVACSDRVSIRQRCKKWSYCDRVMALTAKPAKEKRHWQARVVFHKEITASLNKLAHAGVWSGRPESRSTSKQGTEP